MQDKFKLLQEKGKDNPFLGDDEEPEGEFLNEFFAKGEQIRNNIEMMRLKVNELKEIYDDSIGKLDTNNKKRQGKAIEDLIDEINAVAARIRDSLQVLSKEIPKDADGLMTEERIKKNIHTTLFDDFLDLMQEYQSLQTKHNEEMRKLVKTQLQIVDPKATDEDVDRAIEAGPQTIFASDRAKAAQESLRYIQNKHSEILKLEKSLEEVHQLFVDMAVLVQEQSETVNRISFQVANAKKDILTATEELRAANKIHRRRCLVM